MLSSPSKPKQLSEAALRQLIAKALEKGWVRQGFHSEVERDERNISDDDILYGLERKDWKVTETRYSEAHKNTSPYSYEILTKDLEGESLEVVVAPNVATGTVKVVTKY